MYMLVCFDLIRRLLTQTRKSKIVTAIEKIMAVQDYCNELFYHITDVLLSSLNEYFLPRFIAVRVKSS